jgi:tetratricopeptide (TPR) repeat protein
MAATLSTLSIARLQGGDPDGAAETEQEALQIFRKLGETRGQAFSLLHQGQIAAFRRDHQAAKCALENSLDVSRNAQCREVESECELVLGQLALERGERELALEKIARSLVVATDAGDRRSQANATWWLAKLHLDAGDLSSARRGLTQAMAAFRAFQMHEELIGCLEDTAGLLQAEGVPADAVRAAGLAQRLREQSALPHWPRQRQQWQERMAALRAELEPQRFEAALDEGRGSDLDALVRGVLARAG